MIKQYDTGESGVGKGCLALNDIDVMQFNDESTSNTN